MGRLVLACKITHVPSLMLSETPGPLYGRRARAIAALKEIGRRARERGADTYLVFDTHWLSNFGFHLNANVRHKGVYTSHEAPHLIQNLTYDLPGNPELAALIAKEAANCGVAVHAHQVPTLPLEYGTIVPMHYMNPDGSHKVVSAAAPLFASVDENRRFGEATVAAIERSNSNVAVLASGSMSHKLVNNELVGDSQWDVVSSEFNRQMDFRVLQLWEQRQYDVFVRLLPEYCTKCSGEALMADTVMLFGALGWDKYQGRTELLCDYFTSSGSGQVSVEFHLDS
jgi:3,4-dihydroxyphenylacetate 2,3-dioxygenase